MQSRDRKVAARAADGDDLGVGLHQEGADPRIGEFPARTEARIKAPVTVVAKDLSAREQDLAVSLQGDIRGVRAGGRDLAVPVEAGIQASVRVVARECVLQVARWLGWRGGASPAASAALL